MAERRRRILCTCYIHVHIIFARICNEVFFFCPPEMFVARIWRYRNYSSTFTTVVTAHASSLYLTYYSNYTFVVRILDAPLFFRVVFGCAFLFLSNRNTDNRKHNKSTDSKHGI